MADNYLNKTVLGYFYNRIKTVFASQTDLNTLSARVEEIIAEGGEPNVIETVKVDGTALTPDAQKAVNIDLSGKADVADVPTKTSDLTNDGDGTSNFATEDYVDENGGKIDSISVNGDPQTIDQNKNVDLEIPDGVFHATVNYTTNADLRAAIADNIPIYVNKHPAVSAWVESADNTVYIRFIWLDVIDPVYSNKAYTRMRAYKINTNDNWVVDTDADYILASMDIDVSEFPNDSADPYVTESEVDAKVVGALKPKGSTTFNTLPALTAANLNNMYNVTDAFTTTADFKEGAGHAYPAGTNVAIINDGTDASPVYKYDAMTGVIDMSGYWSKTELTAITTAEIDTIIDGPSGS